MFFDEVLQLFPIKIGKSCNWFLMLHVHISREMIKLSYILLRNAGLQFSAQHNLLNRRDSISDAYISVSQNESESYAKLLILRGTGLLQLLFLNKTGADVLLNGALIR